MAQSSQIDLSKLRPVMDNDYREMEAFRVKRLKHVAEYLGSEYGLGTIENPVNFVSQFITTFTTHLVGDNARALITSFKPQLRPFAEAMMDWINPILKAMRFSDILATSVISALFLVGITYTAITSPIEARFGYYRAPGEPGVFNIDFQDFICDMSVACFKECEYQGHYYYANYDDVKAYKAYKKDVRSRLEPTERTMFNKGGDARIETLAAYNQGDDERYEDYIRLCQVWMPRYKKIITFEADGEDGEVLLEQDWIGPDCGPYQFLSFQQALGKLLPKAPIMDIIPLARSLNEHWKHLDNQASQQKSIMAYQNEEDAVKAKSAKQGAFVGMKNPGGMIPIEMFGPNQQLSIWTGLTYERLNEVAGNPRTLSGLTTSAKTATQEKLINSSASKLVESMSKKTIGHAQEIMNCLGWFYWNNPNQKFDSTYTVPGMPGITADRSVSPQDRMEIPWEQMDLQIDPYSLNFVPPGDRANILDGMLKNVFVPLGPLFSKPGIGKLLAKYIKFTATYRNMPELVELGECLIGVENQPQQEGGGAEPQPAEKTTTHERVSRPGMTDQGNEQQLMQQMAGQDNQGQEYGEVA